MQNTSKALLDTAQAARCSSQPPRLPSALKSLLDTDQAAELLKVSATTLTTWRCRKTHQLAFYKIGGRVRYSEDDLIRFMESRRVEICVPA
jgi:excisionase family DNA binding protein